MKARLQRLYDFIESGLLKVKVLPDEDFGLIHGKACVITRTNGSQVCFIGNANESQTAAARPERGAKRRLGFPLQPLADPATGRD